MNYLPPYKATSIRLFIEWIKSDPVRSMYVLDGVLSSYTQPIGPRDLNIMSYTACPQYSELFFPSWSIQPLKRCSQWFKLYGHGRRTRAVMVATAVDLPLDG